MTVCDGPVCICGLSDDRCVCGCVVPEAAPIADFLPSAAKAAAMAVELPPPPAEPTVGPPVKRTAFSSRYELQRGELREIDSEAQLEAVAAQEIAMQRKRKRWKPPAPEDLYTGPRRDGQPRAAHLPDHRRGPGPGHGRGRGALAPDGPRARTHGRRRDGHGKQRVIRGRVHRLHPGTLEATSADRRRDPSGCSPSC